MLPAEVVDAIFPELFPAHGEHSLTCPCRGTDDACWRKGTAKGVDPHNTTGVYNPYAVAGYSAYYAHLAAAQQVD